MIPHIIHYCWFGKKEMPELAVKCIESWKKYLPSWQIMRWEESTLSQALSKKPIPSPCPKGKGEEPTSDKVLRKAKSQEFKYEVFEPNKTPRHIDRKNEIVDGETYLNTRMGYACYAWQFILRRDIILNLKSEIINHKSEIDDCLFTPGLHFEDVDWLPRMMLRAKRVNSTQTIVYNYFIRQGSITKTQGDKGKIRKNLEDRMKIIETYSAYLKQYPSCSWHKNMQSNMVAGVLTTVAQEFYAERMEYIGRLQALNVFPLSIADQGETFKCRARIIDIVGPRIYCMVMHYAR